jgi:hypothetical protein
VLLRTGGGMRDATAVVQRYVCMCVCGYVCMCVCVQAVTVCFMCVSVCVFMYVRVLCVCVCVFMYVRVYVCIQSNTVYYLLPTTYYLPPIHIHTYTHTHTHTHIHIHIYTYSLNAACRVARQNPSWPVSRLLLSLSDADLPNKGTKPTICTLNPQYIYQNSFKTHPMPYAIY